ncbi:hypothetical protein GQ55_9G373100 [Panicum hallii var. hallii]|uniref:Uncharacterized protein n=1 Tax=Panicum hallii var. hallii TaxID=1504633 RepID=A0A2T7C908_9POAL|nr:hypothetical protein GQ55_9G373100 [Panicum hallii var. hallii]
MAAASLYSSLAGLLLLLDDPFTSGSLYLGEEEAGDVRAAVASATAVSLTALTVLAILSSAASRTTAVASCSWPRTPRRRRAARAPYRPAFATSTLSPFSRHRNRGDLAPILLDAPRSAGSSPLTRAERRSTMPSDGGRPRPNRAGIWLGNGNHEALSVSSVVSPCSGSTAMVARRAPARVRLSPERRSSAMWPARQVTPDQKTQGSALAGRARRLRSAATSCGASTVW